jgi:hypothetical protein
LRWEDEVLLVREEMRRVVRYLDWLVNWWRDRLEARPDATAEVQASARAYALKQATLYSRLAMYFQEAWTKPGQTMICRVLAGPQAEELEGAELDGFFEQLQ